MNEDQENVCQLPTPKTPRHKHVLAKVPITPRHRIGLTARPTPSKSSLTPASLARTTSVYNDARQLFTKGADSGRLVGRTDERAELTDFITSCLSSHSGGAMYISGPPGTGKSALVNEVCKNLNGTPGARVTYANCMTAKKQGDVLEKLADDLMVEQPVGDYDHFRSLQELFTGTSRSNRQISVVVLDEIDHLLNVDLDVLYQLFEWSLCRTSRLVIVGIANALDLTDRFLPLLRARALEPRLLPFLPYNASQIASIISEKLRSLGGDSTQVAPTDLPLFQPAAVQLCSKKVASLTGDLRKAFDIVRQSLDVIELETKQKLRTTSDDEERTPTKVSLERNSSPSLPFPASTPTKSTLLSSLTLLTAPKVTIAQVSRVSSAAFGNGTMQRLQALHLQQKAALCALLSHQREAREKSYIGSSVFATPSKKSLAAHLTAPTIRALHETYSTLCRRENSLQALTVTEFMDVINGLETMGLVGEESKGGKGIASTPPSCGRKKIRNGIFGCIAGTVVCSSSRAMEERRIVSFVGQKEVEESLDGPGGDILRGLLKGE